MILGNIIRKYCKYIEELLLMGRGWLIENANVKYDSIFENPNLECMTVIAVNGTFSKYFDENPNLNKRGERK